MSGAQSSLGDPNDRREWLPAYCIVLETLGTFFVSLRLLSRLIHSSGGFGLDDLFLVFGWVFGTGATLLFMIGALSFGFDRHVSAFTSKLATEASMNGWLGEILYIWSTGCTKIAVLLLYRRLLSSTLSRRLRIATYSAITFTGLYIFTFTILLLTECRPLNAIWMRFDPQWKSSHAYKCLGSAADVTAPLSGALSVVGDVYALAIPAFLLAGLQIAHRQKIGLYGVFSLGVFVIVAGIARTVYLTQAIATLDRAWVGANALICSTIEIQLALICACAPSLRIIVKKYCRRPITRHTASNNSWDSSGSRGFSYSKPPLHHTVSSKSKASVYINIDLSPPFLPEPPKKQPARMSRPPRISGLDFLRGNEFRGSSFWVESIHLPAPAEPPSARLPQNEVRGAVRMAPRIESVQVATEWWQEPAWSFRGPSSETQRTRPRETSWYLAARRSSEVSSVWPGKNTSWYREH